MTATVHARRSATDAVAETYDRIDADGRDGIWIERLDRPIALARARSVDRARRRGDDVPLAGLTLAVKGNIDVEGLRTTAGCPAFGEIADRSAISVRRLEAAGAVVIGVTNLDQFATGLVGTRSPHGVCPNAHWSGRIAGGSSAGSAVAVAAGHVDLALGTDTAGSGRVPAAANGIIGFKPTPGRIPTDGVVPACRSFDCVSVFGTDLALVELAASIAAGDRPTTSSGPRSWRLAVPATGQLDFDGDRAYGERHAAAIDAVVQELGAEVVPVDLEPYLAAGALLYGGAFLAERYEAVGPFIDEHPDEVDPVVAQIIQSARSLPAWQLVRDRAELQRLRDLTAATWETADALLLPTVPRVPLISEVLAEPFTVNAMLGTYTSFVNLLDLAALSLPVGSPSADGPPASLSLIAPAGSDALLLHLGQTLLGA